MPDLIEALAHFELEVVVAGLTEVSPGLSEVGRTNAFLTADVLVGVPPDEPVPGEIEGLPVAAEQGSIILAWLEDEGAVPVPVDDLSSVEGLVAAPRWRLRELGFEPTRLVLSQEKHVMLVPPGENGWLYRLEHPTIGSMVLFPAERVRGKRSSRRIARSRAHPTLR